jgi:hypothetical protein
VRCGVGRRGAYDVGVPEVVFGDGVGEEEVGAGLLVDGEDDFLGFCVGI